MADFLREPVGMFTLRLLVVEKSRGLQTYVRQLFESFGFNPKLIKTADCSQVALEVAPLLQPDFLLTEWFPRGNISGIELYQQLLPYNPECRFALLHGETGPEQVEQATAAGAIFLQVKPCPAADLRSALGKALQQLAAENPKLDSHVSAAASAAARHLSALTIAAKTPHFKAGDSVLYRGNADSVKNVIFRKGEMVVQLSSNSILVPAGQVSKA
jgi:DNA-binding NtrC family response regulator